MRNLAVLLKDVFTDREFGFLYDCMKYTSNRPENVIGPAGLPGHNLILIIVKLFKLLLVISSYLTEDRAVIISKEAMQHSDHDIIRIDILFEELCKKEDKDNK